MLGIKRKPSKDELEFARNVQSLTDKMESFTKFVDRLKKENLDLKTQNAFLKKQMFGSKLIEEYSTEPGYTQDKTVTVKPDQWYKIMYDDNFYFIRYTDNKCFILSDSTATPSHLLHNYYVNTYGDHNVHISYERFVDIVSQHPSYWDLRKNYKILPLGFDDKDSEVFEKMGTNFVPIWNKK